VAGSLFYETGNLARGTTVITSRTLVRAFSREERTLFEDWLPYKENRQNINYVCPLDSYCKYVLVR
jgi:hypothetical protein